MGKILVTGAHGQLGSEIKEIIRSKGLSNYIFNDIDTLDISDINALNIFFNNNEIDIIVNCAAYNLVDKAEKEKELAYKINHLAVKNLANISERYKSKLIHISTDFVFDGNNSIPYKESDKANPFSVYSKSKFEGEKEVLKIKDSIVIRTSWLYSCFGNNFVKTIIRLGHEMEYLNVVSDQAGTPTYANDLAKAICTIIKQSEKKSTAFKSGLYHYSNEGIASWYDFAMEIKKLAGFKCPINPVSTKDYPLPAKRPKYSVLDKSKIKKDFNLIVPNWKVSLEKCISVLLNQ